MLRRGSDDMRSPIIDDDELSPSTTTNQHDNELDPELTGCGATMCCNPTSGLHRFIALIFMCLLGFGSYFCYDNPGALQDNFIHELNLTTTEFTMIYSIYSWPNVILCFIGGFLIDRVFGIRLGTIIYLFIVLVGQFLFAFGAVLNTYWLIILGRFIFGIGAESLAVAQNNYAVLWFKGKELNMVFGLQLSIARVGSAVNYMLMEPLLSYVSKWYHGHTAIGVVLLLAASTCVMSFICALVLGWMDKRCERITRRQINPGGETVQLSDITTFSTAFWMVSVICVAYYVAIFPFIALGKVFFVTKFGFTPEQANAVNSIVYFISAVASPLFGFLIDKVGRNVTWVFLATCSTIAAHSILAFTYINPYFGMSLMGLSYSMLASSLWPIVALIIPEYQLGSAYGICQSVQNLGLAVVSILSGMIVDKTNKNYTILEMFFISWLTIALIATIVIWIYDKKNKGNLNLSPSQRKAFQDAHTVSAIGHLTGSGSVDDINPGDISSSVRNRLLRRNDDAADSDQEPLLN